MCVYNHILHYKSIESRREPKRAFECLEKGLFDGRIKLFPKRANHCGAIDSKLWPRDSCEEIKHVLAEIKIVWILIAALAVAAVIARPTVAKVINHAIFKRSILAFPAVWELPACRGCANLGFDCLAGATRKSAKLVEPAFDCVATSIQFSTEAEHWFYRFAISPALCEKERACVCVEIVMHREWTGSWSGMLIPKRKKTIEVWYLEVEW